ncbi:TonB-dependent receptor [Dysgonomonas sp. 511]|uniref:TonB-dependent receptor n=1 Tax=Dysgonomonas sp. 511 TaxID=2302930 RepID=UPI0013D105D1|nr:TonB-dependent receptor [Dysgonomonas sp. 511]NDV78963.1 TonB-dependent receptor [Dysgonomonas sp. 511]
MQKMPAVIYLIFCCFLTFPVFAQRTVTGTVFDSNNEVLPGVSVVLKGNNNIATSSDVDGHYTLSLPNESKEYIIQVSFIGYIPQEQKLDLNRSDKVDFFLKEQNVDLDMVVITGTRTPKLLKNTPIITKVITKSDIKKVDATHIGELLQSELPGIEFSYSMNQQVSLNMQGFGGNSVLFLVDGERIAGETLDNIDYSRLNLDNVERVEIIKGAASTLYGSSAVGGVVNIISKPLTEAWTANINSRFSAHNGQRHGGSVGFKAGQLSSTTNIQHTTEDGYKMKNDGAYKEVLGGRTWSFKENLQYTVNDRIKLTGRAGYFFRERDPYLDNMKDKDSPNNKRDRYRDFSGGLKGDYTINKKNSLELAYSFDQYDKSVYLVPTSKDTLNYRNVQHTVRGLYSHSFDNKNNLIIGGDYMRDYLMTYQFENNGSHRQYVADIFAQLDLNPLDKLSLITGLRYDYFSENSLKNFSTSIAVMYRIGNCSLRGSYAGGFRAPSLKEMYMNFFMGNLFNIYGNPELKPERSQNLSLSTEYTNSYYNLSVTGYYNQFENRITTVTDQGLKGMVYTNIENVDISGLDINASVKYPCGIGARLSYNYTHEDFKKGQPRITVTRPHTATARIEYGKSWKNYGFNIMLNGRFLSKVTSDEYDSGDLSSETASVSYPAYTVWKLSLLQNIWKGIDLTLAVDNLFNYVPSYYYSNSLYTNGTTFSAGVSIDIDKLFK